MGQCTGVRDSRSHYRKGIKRGLATSSQLQLLRSQQNSGQWHCWYSCSWQPDEPVSLLVHHAVDRALSVRSCEVFPLEILVALNRQHMNHLDRVLILKFRRRTIMDHHCILSHLHLCHPHTWEICHKLKAWMLTPMFYLYFWYQNRWRETLSGHDETQQL